MFRYRFSEMFRSSGIVLLVVGSLCGTSTASAEDEKLASFNAMFDRISNWGRWGPEDQLGTLNLITPEKRRNAANLVQAGLTASLARNMDKKPNPINFAPIKHMPFLFEPEALGIDPSEAQEAAGDVFEINYHGFSHTHLDAVNHFARNGKMYNGYPFKLTKSGGFADLGIEHIGVNGIVSRGVLVDFPALTGKDYIPAGTRLTAADLEAWEAKSGVKIGSGDVLLIRTGRWQEVAARGYWPFADKAAGLDYTVAEWLKARNVAAIGCDGVSDVMPSGVPTKLNPLHELVIVGLGMPIFDNMDLDRLAAEMARLNRSTFLFSATPIRVEGATGAPLNPIAVY